MTEAGETVAIVVGGLTIAGVITRVARNQARTWLRGELEQEVNPKLNEIHQCVDRGFKEVNGHLSRTDQRVARIEGSLGIEPWTGH